jgi:lysozyme family protein
MADNFDSAIEVVLRHEGGFVNDPDDPGGATKYGVSLYYLKANGDIDHDDVNHDGRIDIEDIKLLTPETAKEYYRRNWWDKYRYSNISNCMIATKVFDIAVNIGGIRANKFAQQAASQCGKLCAADGVLGPNSFNAICAVDPNCFVTNFEALVASRYRLLTIENPKLSKYLKGWLRRVYE